MSQTDGITQTAIDGLNITHDIPLPDDEPNAVADIAQTVPQPQVTAVTADHQQYLQTQPMATHITPDVTASVMAANPYATGPSIAAQHQQQLQQSYQAYYQQYYSSAAAAYQQMAPQMMPQMHGYYMPQMMATAAARPMMQQMTVPHIQTITPQMAAIVNHNSNHSNNAANNTAADAYDEGGDDSSDSDPTIARHGSTKASNVLPIHCNEKMGLNPLIFQNIQNSPYFKNNLFQLKTYHEVIDEIFYSVRHLEPWEKGSRKVGGQTGMCGSVRGVGAGGIISSPFCLLYKLFTLKLTRKQVNGLIRHKDSPYIRALGFMYIRYTQPPQHLFNWLEPFLEDEEEVDPKAGGGQPMTIGQMCRHMLTKLDWYSSLFPRVPVPIQKEIESKLKQRDDEYEEQVRQEKGIEDGEVEDEEEYEDNNQQQDRDDDQRARDRNKHRRPDRERRSSTDRRRSRSRDRERRSRSRDDRRSNDKHRYRQQRSRSPQSHSHTSSSRGDHRNDKTDHKRRSHR